MSFTTSTTLISTQLQPVFGQSSPGTPTVRVLKTGRGCSLSTLAVQAPADFSYQWRWRDSGFRGLRRLRQKWWNLSAREPANWPLQGTLTAFAPLRGMALAMRIQWKEISSCYETTDIYCLSPQVSGHLLGDDTILS